MSKFKPRSGADAIETNLIRPLPRAKTFPINQPPLSESSSPALPASTYNEASGIAIFLTLSFIFLRFSFLHEILAEKLGFDTHLLLIVGGAAILAGLVSGKLAASLSHRICVVWIVFVALMGLATSTSIWRGGSFGVLFPFLRTTVVLVVLIPTVAQSPRTLSQVLKGIGWAGLTTIVFGLTMRGNVGGRWEMSGGGEFASIENPNDFAALLVLTMPAVVYLCLRSGSSKLMKLIGVLGLGLGCTLLLTTGSRGALISILCCVRYTLKQASAKGRLVMLLVVPLLVLATFPFVPTESLQRLESLFTTDKTGEPTASADQRKALLTASLDITLKHPLLGVGPGTFQEYEALEAKRRGERGMWHETHNSYTQVSSECGIPAALTFLCAIYMSFRVFRRGQTAIDPEIRIVSTTLAVTIVSFGVCRGVALMLDKSSKIC
jgi:O-antigen ligase